MLIPKTYQYPVVYQYVAVALVVGCPKKYIFEGVGRHCFSAPLPIAKMPQKPGKQHKNSTKKWSRTHDRGQKQNCKPGVSQPTTFLFVEGKQRLSPPPYIHLFPPLKREQTLGTRSAIRKRVSIGRGGIRGGKKKGEKQHHKTRFACSTHNNHVKDINAVLAVR